jgi:hypothetical protein
MPLEWLAHAGVVADLAVFGACFAILAFGYWSAWNPVLFWDQFNPYLKPYSRLTLALGRLIGSLWAFGAALACVVTLGDAVRALVQHHWIG